jgi:hypothetical protein
VLILINRIWSIGMVDAPGSCAELAGEAGPMATLTDAAGHVVLVGVGVLS